MNKTTTTCIFSVINILQALQGLISGYEPMIYFFKMNGNLL